jgi:uncharacterized protein YndB with AHSA1/START domain
MEMKEKTNITIEATIYAAVERVWDFWTNPDHIIKWNNASTDWYTPRAENDLRVGGRFFSRMEARDGSSGFDFTGTYTTIEPYKQIDYTMDDGRKVQASFFSLGNITIVKETFEAEETNPAEMQRNGWLAILDNFKKYVETI